MDIEKEREAFEAWFLSKYQYSAEYFQITKFDADRGFYTAIDHYNPDSVNSAWVLRSSFDSWQAAKAQAVPEGFVVVSKEPTQDQLEYGYRCGSTDAKRIYSVMITSYEDY